MEFLSVRMVLSLSGDSTTSFTCFMTNNSLIFCLTEGLAVAVRANTGTDGTNALNSPTLENSGLKATSSPFCKSLEKKMEP